MVEKILELNNEKNIFWALSAILFLFIGFYIYFINATVHNVVLRQDLESEASQLTLMIGNQEFEYITKRNNITLALAHSMGFKDSNEKVFVSKKSGSQVSLLTKIR